MAKDDESKRKKEKHIFWIENLVQKHPQRLYIIEHETIFAICKSETRATTQINGLDWLNKTYRRSYYGPKSKILIYYMK